MKAFEIIGNFVATELATSALILQRPEGQGDHIMDFAGCRVTASGCEDAHHAIGDVIADRAIVDGEWKFAVHVGNIGENSVQGKCYMYVIDSMFYVVHQPVPFDLYDADDDWLAYRHIDPDLYPRMRSHIERHRLSIAAQREDEDDYEVEDNGL
jgi:hypothetical protein